MALSYVGSLIKIVLLLFFFFEIFSFEIIKIYQLIKKKINKNIFNLNNF